MAIDEHMSAESGRKIREDGTKINAANYLAPIPNGDQVITVSAAGVKTLSPPNTENITAKVYCPVDCWVRFGAVPSVNNGEYFAAGDEIVFESAEEIAAAQIYVTAACTLFAQFYK